MADAPMTPTTLAETILRDVPKDALAKIVYDAMRFERQNDTPDWADGGNSCAQAEARHTAAKVQDAVLAALTAAMDSALSDRAGEVLEALRACANGIGSFKTQKGDFGLCDDAADLITALLVQNAALRAERDELRAAIFGSPDYDPALRNGNFREMAETLHVARAGGVARAEAAEAREERLRGALVEHNDILRSSLSIAKREGVDGEIASTNWDAYYNRVAVVLKRHHQTANEARAAHFNGGAE